MGKNNSPNQFYQIVKVLQMIIGNIVKDPVELKYQTLKLNNAKIKQHIGSNMECINLMEILGFLEMNDIVSQEDGLQVVLQISQSAVLENY